MSVQPQARSSNGYAVSPLPDFSDKPTRARLTASALQAFFNILSRWNVGEEDGMKLLGGVSRGKYYALKRQLSGVLDQDKMTRVSYLVGIFKALNILYSESLADAWPGLPNKNRLFAGSTPVEYMVRGGLPAMGVVRGLLDARRGGA